MNSDAAPAERSATRRILVLGATGVFGRRLVQRLSLTPGLEIIVTSRSQAKADELVRALQSTAAARLTALALDHRHGFASALERLKPWAVLDASGPFQNADYRIPLAALAAGVHVIDLADAKDYLAGFAAAVHPSAQAKGLVALSGASSTPALSVAVADLLVKDWQRVDAIDLAITPDGHNDVGSAAVAGVMSYAGVELDQFRHGRMQTVPGWLQSEVITVPGVGRRRVAPVQTIDAQLMRERFRPTSRIAFRAGLESPLEQWGVWALAQLRNWSVLKDISPLVPWLVRGRGLTRFFAGKTGGMIVRARGLDAEGVWTEALWSLVAREGQGPNVPILPMVAALRMVMRGEVAPGGRLAAGVIPLAAIEREFAGLAITTHIKRKTVPQSAIEAVLGASAWAALPNPIRRFHDMEGEPVWTGQAAVTRGRNPVARLIGRIIGLPGDGSGISVRVSVERDADGHERWTRMFGNQQFHSDMRLTPAGALTESFGPTRFALGLTGDATGTSMPVARGWVFGMPLPRFLLPISQARETLDADGRFRFDVRISLPVFGLLAHYQGWLKPVP